MSRNYPRLEIEPFGRHLIQSGDLDPIYIALARASFDDDLLKRWLIAYWCFYHAGAACFLSSFQGYEFWTMLLTAARNEVETPVGGRWPRGHERRHFRGALAVSSVEALASRYGSRPETMVHYIADFSDFTSAVEGYRQEFIRTEDVPVKPGDYVVHMEEVRMASGDYIRRETERRPFYFVSKRAQTHRGFGPWIGFKIADMIDRCLDIPVSFDNAAVFMFDDPTEAALKLWRHKSRLPETAKPKDKDAVINEVVQYLIHEFKDLPAPPYGDRPVNVQEVETVLCKWKSHCNGHYPLNNDIVEIRTGCLPWAEVCTTAKEFLEVFPEEK